MIMEESNWIGPVLTGAGVLFTISQAAFLFLWNNIRAEIKEEKMERQRAFDEIWKAVESKASAIDVENRRNDIREIFNKLNDVEKQVIELKALFGNKRQNSTPRRRT